jgi:ABC-2 type transport system permease protein
MIRALLVAQREFLENVRTKGFWIGILMLPLMLTLVLAIPLVVESSRDAKTYVVIDQSGWLLAAVQRDIDAADLAKFLQAAESNSLPPALDAVNVVLPHLDDRQREALALQILATRESSSAIDPVELPPAAQIVVQQHGVQIATWWHSLAMDEKSRYAPGASVDRFIQVVPQTADPMALNERIREGSLFAYFVIGPDPVKDSTGARYVSNNLTNRDLLDWFGSHVTRQVRRERLRQEHLSPDVAAWIGQPLAFEGVQISTDGVEEQVGVQDVARQWTPVVFVYLLWISVLINTQMLLTNMIEEKSNKLMEVLLSSISATALMAGKIIGIAATGLTIILSWTLMALGMLVLLPALVGIELPMDITVANDPWYLTSFLVYFVLGYLLYAAILVGLGSVCSNLKEAQNLILPVQLIQIIPIIVMVPIGRDPNGTLAQVLSYFPPLTPFVMMNRAAAPPTTTEYVTTTLLLVASIVVAFWFAGKIFRLGILLTGKPPGIREIWRWLKAPVTDSR